MKLKRSLQICLLLFLLTASNNMKISRAKKTITDLKVRINEKPGVYYFIERTLDFQTSKLELRQFIDAIQVLNNSTFEEVKKVKSHFKRNYFSPSKILFIKKIAAPIGTVNDPGNLAKNRTKVAKKPYQNQIPNLSGGVGVEASQLALYQSNKSNFEAKSNNSPEKFSSSRWAELISVSRIKSEQKKNYVLEFEAKGKMETMFSIIKDSTKGKYLNFFIFLMTQIAEAFSQAHEKNVLVGPLPATSIFVLNFDKKAGQFEDDSADLTIQDQKVEVFLTSAEKLENMTINDAYKNDRVNLGVILCPIMMRVFLDNRMIECDPKFCDKSLKEDEEEEEKKKEEYTVYNPYILFAQADKKQICKNALNHVKAKLHPEFELKEKELINLMDQLLTDESNTQQITSMKNVVEKLKAIRIIELEFSREKKSNKKKLSFHPCAKSETADEGKEKF